MLHKDERSLVQKFEGQPFVILGVNNDPDPATLRGTQREQHITWRSWWDEDGSITRQWGVEGFPTLFLIDATGKIRWISPGKPSADKLQKKIEELLQEMRPSA
jgi:peroxiredoxin